MNFYHPLVTNDFLQPSRSFPLVRSAADGERYLPDRFLSIHSGLLCLVASPDLRKVTESSRFLSNIVKETQLHPVRYITCPIAVAKPASLKIVLHHTASSLSNRPSSSMVYG